ncbi:MAG: hypothetical protein E6Q35_02870 [Chryseobacterium cucumeris]|nr:MAG: hypothetical protein E6Q35_02870 [Chryseobacterium cucumeris]
MRYLAGKNTLKDSYSISFYVVNNEDQTVSVSFLAAEVRNGEIQSSVKQVIIRNTGAMIIDPDFVKPAGFSESDPNTWGVPSLPKVTDSQKEFWEYFKNKENLGTEKAVFETLIHMGEIPSNGTYKS